MDCKDSINPIKDQKVPVKPNLDIRSFDVKQEEIWISNNGDGFEVEILSWDNSF